MVMSGIMRMSRPVFVTGISLAVGKLKALGYPLFPQNDP